MKVAITHNYAYRATMVRFKNFECTINVEGVPLPEHTDPNDAGDREGPVPTAIVYVQSEEGKAFSVRLGVLDGVGIYPEANSVNMELSLDGVTGLWWNVGVHKHISARYFRYDDTDGQFVQRKFLFSKLDVLEETRDPENGDLKSLGEITVSLHRFNVTGRTPWVPFKMENEDFPSIKSVPEKHLKGRDIGHSIG
jgi:hypothetical protein